ncbi:hypothetical protein [Nostoc sp. 106C]|uniref:hypothetical protein n=1 Tax=Nostoc sp. 106C TaxID=1932667 RepID=UPI00141236B8|nr:hypothetical protein [Nostoc sp. 106C]
MDFGFCEKFASTLDGFLRQSGESGTAEGLPAEGTAERVSHASPHNGGNPRKRLA